MSTCRYCDAPIIWANHAKSGKRMPFDHAPDETLTKGWSLRRRGNETVCVYIHERGELPAFRRPHFETCPNYQPKPKVRDEDYRKLMGGGR